MGYRPYTDAREEFPWPRSSPSTRESVVPTRAPKGHVIYLARKARNLRQSDLAELSGVAQADISRIERGQIAPTVATLLKLADALGAQIQFVLPPSEGNFVDAENRGEVFALSVGT